MPTILSIFGVEGEAVDGYNLLPVMSGSQEGQRDHVITGWSSTAGIRTPEWLLMLETVNAESNPRIVPKDSVAAIQRKKGAHNYTHGTAAQWAQSNLVHPEVASQRQGAKFAPAGIRIRILDLCLIGDSLRATTYTHQPTC